MTELFVLDTNAIIETFPNTFHRGSNISRNTSKKIKSAIFENSSINRISIPSVVFLEIHDNFCKTEEQTRQIFYDIYLPIKESENVEIRSIDKELLEIYSSLDGVLENHDTNDKLIMANAIMLKCTLISNDPILHTYNSITHVLPDIIY